MGLHPHETVNPTMLPPLTQMLASLAEFRAFIRPCAIPYYEILQVQWAISNQAGGCTIKVDQAQRARRNEH